MTGFIETSAGAVPRVDVNLSLSDKLGTVGARTGFSRNNYLITPGLYSVGEPDKQSPVLVTANYKLTFDAVRKELKGVGVWLLVIDTRGINVWCAAGKGTFCAEEIAYQVQRTKLDTVVAHRELILPQLSASGVAAHTLKKLCGFKGLYGPIAASDLPRFLSEGQDDEGMRTVTFTLCERAVLIPLEICMLWKQLLVMAGVFVLLSGISPTIFSLSQAFDRGVLLIYATIMAILSGAVATPLLLPWLLFRQFWLKGAVLGLIASLAFLFMISSGVGNCDKIALCLWLTGASSYLAMNFTGSTPFTSLSGVKKEMRSGVAFQVGAAALALLFWLLGPFF